MKEKMYVVLYYLAFVITFLFVGYASYINNSGLNYVAMDLVRNVLLIVNLLLVIVFTVLLLKKKKVNEVSIVFPIVYLCFFIVIVVLCFMFNNKLIVYNMLYMQFPYYGFFINLGFLFLNIYSLLSLQYRKK